MFNFGGSSSRSNSQSTSDAYGYSGSNSYGSSQQGSSSLSDSLSTSTSRGGGQSSSWQTLAFEDMFRELYGNASGAAGRAATLAPGLQQQADMLFSGGLSFLDQLQGAGAGQDYLNARIGDTSARDAQLAALQQGLGTMFREEINPQITNNAIASGTLGGRRQGAAQGRAAEGLAAQYQQGAAQSMGQDQLQRDSIASSLMQSQQQGAAVGLGSLGSLYGIAQGGMGAELAPYEMLSSILGGPTVLGGSQSTQFSEADSSSIAKAISESFGVSEQAAMAFAEDWARSQSTSSSKSKSINFGFGGGG